jgi:hypothetical protein
LRIRVYCKKQDEMWSFKKCSRLGTPSLFTDPRD